MVVCLGGIESHWSALDPRESVVDGSHVDVGSGVQSREFSPMLDSPASEGDPGIGSGSGIGIGSGIGSGIGIGGGIGSGIGSGSGSGIGSGIGIGIGSGSVLCLLGLTLGRSLFGDSDPLAARFPHV